MSGNERSISSLGSQLSDESPVMRESAGVEIGYDEPQDERAHYENEIQAESSNNLREVRIQPLDSGYLVKVGCQPVAVETNETLLRALGEYLNNPDSFERAWNKNKNRSKL